MNSEGIAAVVAAYKGSRKLVKVGQKVWSTVRHRGKKKCGSVILADDQGRGWKVRVRWTGNRGHYLKIAAKGHDAEEIRAGTIRYFDKPEKYERLAQAEWDAFAVLADGESDWAGREDDPELTAACTAVLTRLVAQQSDAGSRSHAVPSAFITTTDRRPS
jgi:hypothetical protein